MFDLFGKKAAARYQTHKDTLDAARSLLDRFEGKDLTSRFPLEYRGEVGHRLRSMREHVDGTMVPAQLGDEELLRELLEDVTLVQIAVAGKVPAAGRETLRAVMYTEIFKALAGTLETTADGKTRIRPFSRSLCESALEHATEAIGWFKPGDTHAQLKISPSAAARLYEQARVAVSRRDKSET